MDSQRIVADRIGDLADPAESKQLIGHADTIENLRQQFASGRMHHAWLISGPKGIGKATLAYQFASEVLAKTTVSAENTNITKQDIAAVKSRVAAGGHANLLPISRPYDDKTKTFKTQITVDQIGRVFRFFAKTSAENSWRVCIVDSVDELNRNAANALLKTLEEPPKRTLFLLVSHSPGKLLPTIRSRCQHLQLAPLQNEEITAVLNNVMADELPSNEEVAKAVELAKGSARRAISLLLLDGLELDASFKEIRKNLTSPDWTKIHTLAGKISLKAKQEQYNLFLELAFDFISEKATDLGEGEKKPLAELAHWCEVWEKTAASARQADSYNLDKKQVILSMFQLMQEAA